MAGKPEKDRINQAYTARGQKVMFESDAAQLYGVNAKLINQTVKKSPAKFPETFMFQLTREETAVLKPNLVIPQKHEKHYLPYVFTELGVLMLANVLNSKKAADVSVKTVETLMKLGNYVTAQGSVKERVNELQTSLKQHMEETTNQFKEYKDAINEITATIDSFIGAPEKDAPKKSSKKKPAAKKQK